MLISGFSLLGVPKYEAIVDADCNDITKFGIYNGDNSATIANRPGTGSFVLLHIPTGGNSSGVFMQIATTYGGDFYIRRKWGTNVSAWKQL